MAQCVLCLESINHRSLAPGTVNLCGYCLDRVPWRLSGCLRCGHQLPEPHYGCGLCWDKSLARDKTFSALNYAFPIDHMLRQFKFNNALVWLKPLAQLMALAVRESHTDNQLQSIQAIIPVPLHPSRLKQRGFNQCYWLGKYLSKALHIPLQTQWCSRAQATTPQAQLSASARKSSVFNAFELNRKAKKTPPKTVVVLDDVITTGCTAEAVSQVLKDAGTEQVFVWTVASAQD